MEILKTETLEEEGASLPQIGLPTDRVDTLGLVHEWLTTSKQHVEHGEAIPERIVKGLKDFPQKQVLPDLLRGEALLTHGFLHRSIFHDLLELAEIASRNKNNPIELALVPLQLIANLWTETYPELIELDPVRNWSKQRTKMANCIEENIAFREKYVSGTSLNEARACLRTYTAKIEATEKLETASYKQSTDLHNKITSVLCLTGRQGFTENVFGEENECVAQLDHLGNRTVTDQMAMAHHLSYKLSLAINLLPLETKNSRILAHALSSWLTNSRIGIAVDDMPIFLDALEHGLKPLLERLVIDTGRSYSTDKETHEIVRAYISSSVASVDNYLKKYSLKDWTLPKL